MEQYIPKSAVLAEIDKMMAEEMKFYETACKEGDEEVSSSPMVYARLQILRSCLDTIEVKEVDLEKEITPSSVENILCYFGVQSIDDMDSENLAEFARHFFELGMRVNNPITAADRGTVEEIIINLKRVEKDYRIALTKEIEWVRNQVKKGE